jgi:multiple sugar transport system ATP-binding protein
MSTIEFKSLAKRFGPQTVLKDIDLRIEEGELVVLVGPSGCGKTTLLRVLAGLEPASGGQVLINGQDMTDALPSDRGLAMVFQSYALYPHMTVQENLSFGMRMRGTPPAEIKARLDKAVAVLQLQDLLHRRPGELSGGQGQRVAIGRAIVQEPGAFLLDEPLSNLDAELRLHLRLELIRLHRELRATMVCVTHDQVEAMTMADRIVVLRNGQVEQVGTPQQLYRQPRNRFVAQFLGSPPMNILPCQDVALPLPQAQAQTATHWGLRPEHWRVVEAQGPDTLLMQVEHTEHLGGHVCLHGTLGGTAHRVCVQTHADHPAQLGQTLVLQPQLECVHLFDAQGARMNPSVATAGAPAP